MKIYISGKITGFPIDVVRDRFNTAESFLESAGFEVVNPMKNGLAVSEPWESHIVKDVELLMSCDAIYMLDCWRHSKGARIEYNIAVDTGKYVLFESQVVMRDMYVMLVQDAIHEATGLMFNDYDNDSRKQNLVFARMLFAHQCRRNNMRLVDIANYIHRGHSAILHLLNVYEDEYKYNAEFRDIADKVNEILTRQEKRESK